MKRITLRNFQLKPTKYLEDLPIMLTRYGKDIAIVKKPQPDNSDNFIDRVDKVTKTEVKIPKPKYEPTIKLCSHGYPPNLCKHRKCRKT